MTDKPTQQNTTIDELAAMVARGFEDVMERMATKDDLANMATKDDIANLNTRIDSLETQFEALKNEISGLRNDLNNFLRITDTRYLELKHRQDIIVSWLVKLADKNQIQIDLKELDYKS